jgi:predicted ATP-grasp superfamily ATP-dependent carboligase
MAGLAVRRDAPPPPGRARPAEPLACVIGDVSLVRPLGEAGVPVVAVVDDPRAGVRRSRHVRQTVVVPDLVTAPEAVVLELVRYGAAQPTPPVLFYEGDHDLMIASRWREALARHFRFVIPDARLVEDLVDKLRFAALAERLGLPVPATRTVGRADAGREPLRDWRRFPCIVKPSVRTYRLHQTVLRGPQKAIRLETRPELDALLPVLQAHGSGFVVQEAIPGGEDRILSYHAYVRPGGEVAGEFTGRKIRTFPRTYGLSTYIEITDDADVKRLGREILARMAFHGVMKLDFKQDAGSGRLYLLEANPRFSLWHHPGARAGVNLPLLVYRDLVQPGAAPPPVTPPRAGVRWMCARQDVQTLRQYRAAGEIGVGTWLRQLATADVVEDVNWSDPLPGLAQGLEIVRRLLGRGRAGPADVGRAPVAP